MEKRGRKTVWILGSGFSKSLGGPLLVDLLSDSSGREARLRLRESTVSADPPRDYGLVYKIYNEHKRGSETTGRSAKHWEHAEDFLTFVDSTDRNSVRRALLMGWLPGDRHGDDDVTNFRRDAVQAVAAECHFLYAAAVKEDESWQPYLRWAGKLSPDTDTVVTFNYDLVLEQIAQSKLAPQIALRGICLPDGTGAERNAVPIYKLHGSVDWFVDNNGEHTLHADFVQSVKKGLMPLIGTPGMSKRTVANRLTPIWAGAKAALEQADVVVFLGYRSPPSDPDARAFVLDAMSGRDAVSGANGPRVRRVHLVLGPNTADPAVVRMAKLIQFTMEANHRVDNDLPGYGHGTPRYEVLRQPLYVEDFLSVYHDRELYGD